jgi:hypothetical protein
MKILAAIFLLMLSCEFTHAQLIFNKQWDKRFGGNNDDSFYSIIQTSDNGYLLCGASNSEISGDKTEYNCDTASSADNINGWIIKTDSLGNKLWDKRFGGSNGENIMQMQQTFDGGYILGGSTTSDSGCDISEPTREGADYWMIKIDPFGNKEWDRRFGGSGDDNFSAIQQTKDSGYILAGESNSPISGDKTQDDWDPTYSTYDYWVVKTDKYGIKQWDKRFGGTDEELMDPFPLLQTNDGGYILGGFSKSGISGDKTQANWAVGWDNFWVVRIDSVGNKVWDHVYGGTVEDDLEGNILATPDGGFLLGGFSKSGASGDKTDSLAWGYWIVKIDSAGNKLWDKAYGSPGAGESILYSLYLTSDGGYLLTGNSTQNAGGNKSENNLGYVQIWMVKTDSAGNQQWDKTIFTDNMVTNVYGIQTNEGCYVAGCATKSGIGGYKTQPNWDVTNSTDDYWILKFCNGPTGIDEITPQLQFNVYPNPFTSELDITLAQQNLKQADFSICNILGQTVYTQHETNLSPTYTKMLDLSYLPNGVYLVEVVVDGEVSVREVVKQ